ncbi:acyl-coenzyme A thioesterase-like protein 13 [Phyllosticta citricarpa]|uniref:Acyl-coenzyme A thioesterase-like protein 13 n=2 Tax=Phyllosticta TaxID=121621 RepID=A0ABR1MIW6_9PEZI
MRSNPKIQGFVESVWRSFQSGSGLEPRLLNNLRITGARLGCVQFQLQIEQQHTNRLKTLHGGTIASMVDLGGSLAVASRGLFATGVSTDISVSYPSSGGTIGQLIQGEARCDKIGRKLAFTTVHFTNEKNQMFARGSHTKYVELAWEDKDNKVNELKAAEAESEKQSVCETDV